MRVVDRDLYCPTFIYSTLLDVAQPQDEAFQWRTKGAAREARLCDSSCTDVTYVWLLGGRRRLTGDGMFCMEMTSSRLVVKPGDRIEGLVLHCSDRCLCTSQYQ